MLIRFSLSIACVLGMASAGLAGGITVLTANSHNAEGLEGTVNAFQALLGGDNNGNAAGPIANGRRQINWDAGVVPFDMPANFFNNAGVFPPTRGAVFSTNAGNEFRVSNSNLVKNPGDPVDNLFDSLNSDYANQFISFSNDRIFTPVGTNVMNVKFFVPATDIAATVKGFGAVFTDVDIAGTTKLDFYNVADDLVGTEFAEVKDGGLSFVGASFDDEDIFRVKITTGSGAILGSGSPSENIAGGLDLVAMDDLLYSEPQAVVPEPGTLIMLGLGLASVAACRARKRRAVE